MFKKIILPIITLVALDASAQTLSNSPYSRYGIGDVLDGGYGQNFAMGGLGTTLNNPNNINVINPASYSTFKLTTFDAGANGAFIKYSDTRTTQKSNTATLGHMTLGLPLWQGKVGAAIGLSPYSGSGYNLTSSEKMAGAGTVTYNYTGSGGTNQFFLGAGYTPAKWVSIGVNASYLFGGIERTRYVVFPADSIAFFNTRIYDVINVGGFLFTYGAQFYKDLPKDNKLIIGFSTNFQTKINSTNSQVIDIYKANGTIITSKDSLPLPADVKGKLVMPAAYRIGVALKNSRYTVGVDAGTQQWSNFSSFGVKDNALRDSYFVIGGLQITPNENALNNYFKLVQYRFGARYAVTPLYLKGTQLDEKAVSFGIGLPILKPAVYGVSFVSLGCELGVRGTRANGLVKENFIRINAAFSFGDKWFTKRKYD